GGKLDAALDTIVKSGGDRPVDAAIALHGLTPVVVPGRRGGSIDRAPARRERLARFASLDRTPVVLPLAPPDPQVSLPVMDGALSKVRTAVSAPVTLLIGTNHYRLPRWQLASMLRLPGAGSDSISLGGKKADEFIAKLQKALNRAPRNATFAVSSHGVRIVPDLVGRTVNVPVTARNIVRAALSPGNRIAVVVIQTKEAKRTKKGAQAMGIKELVSSYT